MHKYPVIIIGAGGHAKVLADCLIKAGNRVLGFLDNDKNKHDMRILNLPVIGDDEIVNEYSSQSVRLVNGIGSVCAPKLRQEVYQFFSDKGYNFLNIIHPTAILGQAISLGTGVQVMAGSIIQPGTKIQCNTIINTGAIVDHDCEVGAHVHISPGTTLSGNVKIGHRTHIGAGSTIIQGITIGSDCLVGAGAVVVKDVPEGATVIGVPARII